MLFYFVDQAVLISSIKYGCSAMLFGDVGMSKRIRKQSSLFNFIEDCGFFFQFDLRNSYKLSAQLNLKNVRKNCELCLRSMNGAWLGLMSGGRKLGYRLPLTESFWYGLME